MKIPNVIKLLMFLANETKNSHVLCVGLMRGQKAMDAMIKTSANLPGVQTPGLRVYNEKPSNGHQGVSLEK